MLYITGIIFSLQIVVAQSLYNQAVKNANFELTTEFLLSSKLLGLLSSWQFLSGLSLFFLATGVNFWMFSKFEFSAIQAATVPFVLGFSLLIGWQFFNEHLSVLNVVGLGVMIAGVILATMR